MRRILLALAGALLVATTAVAQVYVRPYVKRDGTMVEGHYRSRPDGNPYNNFSYPGNVNPYTGRVAPGNPETYLRDNSRQGPAVRGFGQ